MSHFNVSEIKVHLIIAAEHPSGDIVATVFTGTYISKEWEFGSQKKKPVVNAGVLIFKMLIILIAEEDICGSQNIYDLILEGTQKSFTVDVKF